MELARAKYGVVSLAQLLSLGLSERAVRGRVAAGHLHRIHRGVYAVGRRDLPRHGHYMAAVLACGPGAVLSHRSAAGLWDLRADNRTSNDVTSSARRGYRLAGIDLHRVRHLDPSDITEEEHIPCTTLARTLLDLAEVIDRQSLNAAIERSEILRIFDLRALDDVLGRASGRRGAATLASLIGPRRPIRISEIELERRFFRLCVEASLPEPIAQARIELSGEVLEVDFLWPYRCLIVETDGYETHGTHSGFERDRRRDQRLMLAGYRVLRFTWRQVLTAPAEVAATVAAALAQSVPRYSGSE